jgi:protein-tyrosine phosphatase
VQPPGLSMGLEKAPNARDLGGYVAADGRRVGRGLLFRADSLHRLSDADLAAMAELKLSCLIDMRSPHEVEAVGRDRLPTPAPGRLVPLPLHDPEEKIFVSIGVLLGRTTVAELPFVDRATAERLMEQLYRWFVSSPRARRTFAEAVRIIADGEALPLMFHCTGGKDRTGWLSAVLLTALGVDREQVIADYLVTEELNAGSNEYLLTVLAKRIPDPLAAMPMLQARREYIDAAFAEVDALFGGMDGYLRDGLELDEPTLAALRDHLLEPAS